ncbi:hypothetical protein C7974DRAFT_134219 [Boeremia exigua]|uniref:uncharacterized protein n=1 Tax=Boeremia exigua TaxID=749465 RepID=UPI001E8E899D|nr:uncharacterized protein C7974DRAFT_134219 [Boeremia exigua]KAH6639550.1 hypothetical protein C7974DRAFT_134219 [Boeremia exigua]
MQTDILRDVGLALVRRFTDELKGDTTLERATMSAQQHQDVAESDLRRKRMQALYQDPNRDPSDFRSHEVETARLALQAVCVQLEKEEKRPSTLQKMGFKRAKPKAAANEALLTASAYDFNSLQTVVEDSESHWKAGQKHIGHRFRNLCNKLDEHKAAFAIFPSQNLYTSALCGSLAMIVGAAANYSDIAERLSEMVADITDKATRAAHAVLIFPTHDFRDLFSRLYAQVFLFYRDAIQWYAKSKFERALESFNESLVKPYETAAARIESLLIEIYRQGDLAFWAKDFLFKEDIENQIRRQREQVQDRDSLLSAGRQGKRLLLLNFEHASFDTPSQSADEEQLLLTTDKQARVPIVLENLSRESMRALSAQLTPFIFGTEGPSLFNDGQVWLPEVDIASKLSKWMSPDTQSSVLWISSPATSRDYPSSRAAAMIMAATAWKSNMSIVSHFCSRPGYGCVPDGQMIEQVGMLGLVYSLVVQLLQFHVERDAFSFSRDKFEKLDGSDESWPGALLLLQDLLRATPQLQGCIVDGLNDLSFSSGAEWCGAFLNMLLEHQRTYSPGFKLLLATTGQSRVLPDYVQVKDRVFAQRGAKEVIRGGRWLNEITR